MHSHGIGACMCGKCRYDVAGYKLLTHQYASVLLMPVDISDDKYVLKAGRGMQVRLPGSWLWVFPSSVNADSGQGRPPLVIWTMKTVSDRCCSLVAGRDVSVA